MHCNLFIQPFELSSGRVFTLGMVGCGFNARYPSVFMVGIGGLDQPITSLHQGAKGQMSRTNFKSVTIILTLTLFKQVKPSVEAPAIIHLASSCFVSQHLPKQRVASRGSMW